MLRHHNDQAWGEQYAFVDYFRTGPEFGESFLLVRLKGLEPPTPGSEDRCSIQLSYRRMQTKPSL